jgi:hypothetical protein
MTSILIVATVAVVVFLGLSCRRARLDLREQLCDCLEPSVPAAVGYGPGATGGAAVRYGPGATGGTAVGPARPTLTRVDGGRVGGAGAAGAAGDRHRHLRVVRAG